MTIPTLPLPCPWARTRINRLARGRQVPAYGSPAWHALPDRDPRRWAAALIAAEAHRYEGETIADRLTVELDAAADDELETAIENGAAWAMTRDAYLAHHAAQVGESCVRFLLRQRDRQNGCEQRA